MGQKVSPTGLRIGINKEWESKWYAENDFAKYLNNDYKIRSKMLGFLKLSLKEMLKDVKSSYMMLNQV